MNYKFISFDAMVKDKADMFGYITKMLKESKYGTFHKCLFHLHTPASHDYLLYESKKKTDESYYKKLSDDELFAIAQNEGLFPLGTSINTYDFSKQTFCSMKEFISYLLIAHKICKNGIELIVISDHNTIDGYSKLFSAINIYTESKHVACRPTIILGIEISCSDRIHIVSILPYKAEVLDQLNLFLKNYIMSQKDGTYLTSIEVINKMHEIGAISYIAHINSSNIFKRDYFNQIYKKSLLNSEYLKVIGLSDLAHLDQVRDRINIYRNNNEPCFVLDSDSHSIDTIGNNCFWIKGQKCNFKMIEKAIRDFSISLQLEKPMKPEKYIKGIAISPARNGFLSGKDKDMFCLTFSEDLNCLIGGRGTGKSTLINTLIYVLSQQCSNEYILESICAHEYVMVLYCYKGEDYVIFFTSPPSEYNYDYVVNRFKDYTDNERSNDRDNYNKYLQPQKPAKFDKEEISKITLKHCILLYKVKDSSFEVIPEKQKKSLLRDFFNVGYSINELVNISQSDQIDKFIQKQLFKNDELQPIDKTSFVYSKSGLLNKINDMENNLKRREDSVRKIIVDYNKCQEGKLIVQYTLNNFGAFDASIIGLNRDDYFFNFNIKNDTLYDYLELIESKVGLLEMLKMFLNKNYLNINMKFPIYKHSEQMNQKLIEKGIKEINDQNIWEFFDFIGVRLTSTECIKSLIFMLRKFSNECERFDLEFNVNNKENIDGAKASYLSIKRLSLGQKVVALLSFILSYGEFCIDYTPLIIDQPEDNLDNQYIYKNLVKDLRDVKVKRQVIIATHSSTIVTNAKAEQVIVMESNGQSGWVQDKGFPTEPRIIKHILNYLEGGIDSFNHKSFIYQDVTIPKR